MRKLANLKINNCVPANSDLLDGIVMPENIWVLNLVREFQILL